MHQLYANITSDNIKSLALFNKYNNNLSKLKYVVFEIDYPTLEFQTDDHYFRLPWYFMHHDIEVSKKPLTKEEEQNLVLNIRQCWNVPVGLENDSSNVIIMGIKLSIDGNLEEDPVNLSPNSGVGMIQAYEAARRAVLRCQPYKLPADKYETWREMEIELDPSEMVLR